MSTHHTPARSPSPAAIVIPLALGIFTSLAIILTIRTIGFAIVAGILVFLTSFVLTLVLDFLIERPPRDKR